MSTANADNPEQHDPPADWYLRVGGKTVYGPVPLSALKEWAVQGRIVPGNEVSADGRKWISAEQLTDLQMQWFAHLKAGDDYGPFHILAAPDMVKRGIIGQDAVLENRATGTRVPVGSLIKAGAEPPRVEWRQVTAQRQARPLPREVPKGSAERGSWYLKVRDGMVYGPVHMRKPWEWTQVGRIGPGNQASEDCRTWVAAECIAELKMDWIARSPDGGEYGPFNLLAIHNLVREGVVSPDSVLRNRHTAKQVPIHSLGNVDEWMRRTEQVAQPDQPSTAEQKPDAAPQALDPQHLRDRVGELDQRVAALSVTLAEAHRALEQKEHDLNALRHSAESQKADFLSQSENLKREAREAITSLESLRQATEQEKAQRAKDDAAREQRADGLLNRIRGLEQSQLAVKVAGLERVCASLRGELETARQAAANEKSRREEAEAVRERAEAALRNRIAELEQAGAAEERLPGGASADWHLKLDDGSVFGPVSLSELCKWATQCRIGADHQVSSDKKRWIPAKDVPELQMDWTVHLVDGASYGPINLEAVRHLIEQGATTPDAVVSNNKTGVRLRLGDPLLRL